MAADPPLASPAVAKLMRVLRHVPDGVVLLDASRRVDLTNDTGERLLAELGAGPGPIVALGGMDIGELIAAAERGVPHDLPVGAGLARRIFSVRALRPSPDTVETLLVLRDVTDIRRREIEQATHERLAVLGQLAGGLAHDFNNVLGVILMITRTYLSAPGRHPPDDMMREIDVAARSAARLTRQLLALGRHERAQPVVLDLGSELRELTQLFARVMADARLELRVAPDLRRVTADPLQIERVVANLVLNARDAMPDGGAIAIAASNGESADVVITVEDGGAGIAPDVLPRIFDPYFTTRSHGSGLGLATVYAIVKQLGGSISVDSELGRGTRFTVCLPSYPDE